MTIPIEQYCVRNARELSTPALLIYAEKIEANIDAALRMMNGDANRWRPHLKTAKLGYTMRCLVAKGVRNAKCATTLELIAALNAGMQDVVLAFPVMGANAVRVKEIAAAHPDRRISVLVEGPEQLDEWHGASIGIFVDLNSGMDRTGMAESHFDEVLAFVRRVGGQFRGLHHYDGQIHNADSCAAATATAGYEQLLRLVAFLESNGIRVEEVVTSGTPAMPHGLAFPGFANAGFIHRVSPGTVVYNDRNSLKELPDCGFVPAALVLSTVVSHPLPRRITCDAGHKSVSADAGVPTCEAIGHTNLQFLKPSEEHLPADVIEGVVPARGEMLYLLPAHVCPTVNNFDKAVIVRNGEVESIEPVSARGREVFVKTPV
jgi:D-serine deaminase-like pyridoxal phosphate-dependent protein